MSSKLDSRGRMLLIGTRKAAVAAARRLGWDPVVIDSHSRAEQVPGAFGGSSSWAMEVADEFFPGEAPGAVVAVATGAVVAAAALREHFGLPGIGSEVARRCHDKLVMKKAVAAAGIPCARWVETGPETTVPGLLGELGLPLVLKLPISSGGRGVWVCQSAAEVSARLRPGLLAEAFVAGAEMSVESFRAAGRTLFRNQTCYLKPRWANVLPAGLDADDGERVDRLAEWVHEALEIAGGITHMELFLGEDGPVFGEIAARPPGGYLMELLGHAYGFDPWEALLRIAAGETPGFPDRATRHAGVWVVHPGPGVVREVAGLEEARAVEGVVDVSCRLRRGDVVAERIGSGESKGRILAEGPSRRACADTLVRAQGILRVSVAPQGEAESGGTGELPKRGGPHRRGAR